MSKHWYAGRHVLGREFSYDSGWTVYVFDSPADRDEFVNTTNRRDYRNGSSPKSEPISRDVARRIAGSWVEESSSCEGDGRMLVQAHSYYNPHYWG